MAKRKADSEEDAAAAPKRTRRDRAETVAQVAHAIRNRDAIVEHALEVLGAIGVIDERTRTHVHGLYERGDARTRLIIQELIARVMRVPVDRLEEALEGEEWDADAMSSKALDALTTLELPEVDVKGTADWVREVDLDGLILRAENKSKVLRFIGDIPVKVHKVQRAMMVTGILLLVVVAAALLFPGQALWIAFFGLLTLIGLLGGLLIKASWQIRRLAKEADLDLVVLARLKPEERRLLLLRRLVVQVFDQRKAGDLLERSLSAVVPDLMRGDPGADPAAQAPLRPATRAARPVRPRAGDEPATTASKAPDEKRARTSSGPKANKKETQRKSKSKDTSARSVKDARDVENARPKKAARDTSGKKGSSRVKGSGRARQQGGGDA